MDSSPIHTTDPIWPYPLRTEAWTGAGTLNKAWKPQGLFIELMKDAAALGLRRKTAAVCRGWQQMLSGSVYSLVAKERSPGLHSIPS